MIKPDDHAEANVARLLGAAYGADARLDSAFRDRTRRLLAQALRFRRSAPAFPDRAIATFGLVFAGTAIWLAIQVAGAGFDQVWRFPGLLITLPLGANLALIPTAAVVVIRGRRRDDQ